MSRRPRVPGSRDPRQTRAALRGLDGGAQLRAALDEMRRRNTDCEVVFVNNGGRGPAIIDTRGLEPGSWTVDGLIPAGVVAAVADLDDPSPAALLDGGFDVVQLLELHGEFVPGVPVRVSHHFHPRFGLEPPAPFWVEGDPERVALVRVDAPEDP